MIVLSSTIGYVKHNRARLKEGKREETKKMLQSFFDQLEGKVTGMKGYMILDNANDTQDSLVLTFWETKQDMDTFYHPSNKALVEFVDKAKITMEQLPQRTDYLVVKYKL